MTDLRLNPAIKTITKTKLYLGTWKDV